MNNIPQKNVVFKTSSCANIPYENVQTVNHYAMCDNINTVDVVNVAAQLVDNDIYVLNQLQSMSAQADGPKVNDSAVVSAAPNGYKVFGDLTSANCLRVLHKVETDISSTIFQLMPGDVQMLHQFGNTVFAAVDGHLYYSFEPVDGTWTELKAGSESVDIRQGFNTELACYFAASDGVYYLSSFQDEGQTEVSYALLRLTRTRSSSAPQIRCLAIDDASSQLVVGTDVGVEIGEYNSQLDPLKVAGSIKLTAVPFYCDNEFSGDDSVTESLFLKKSAASEKTLVVFGAHGIYKRDTTTNLRNLQTLTTESKKPLKDVTDFNGRLVFASDDGLFAESLMASSKTLVQLFPDTLSGQSIVKILQSGSSSLLVGTQKAVFRANRGLDSLSQLVSVEDIDGYAEDEIFVSFCLLQRSNLLLGVTDHRIFVVDLNTEPVYPKQLSSNADISEYLRIASRSSSELKDIKDVELVDDYVALQLEGGIGSLRVTLEGASITQKIAELSGVDLDAISSKLGDLRKIITVGSTQLGVFLSGIASLDGKASAYTSSIIDAIDIEYNGTRDCIAVLADVADKSEESDAESDADTKNGDGQLQILRYDENAKTLSVILSTEMLNLEASDIRELSNTLVVTGSIGETPNLSVFSKSKLKHDSNQAGILTLDVPFYDLTSDHADELYAIDLTGHVNTYLETEILSAIDYSGPHIYSLASLPNLSLQILATNEGISSYRVSSSGISSSIDTKTSVLTADGIAQTLYVDKEKKIPNNASRVAVIDKDNMVDARLLWIDGKSNISSAWLSAAVDGTYIYDSSEIAGSREIVDLAQIDVDSTNVILAVDETNAYKVVFSYDVSQTTFGGFYYGLAVPNAIDLEFGDYDGLMFFLPSSSSMCWCKGDDGSEFKDFTKIPATSKKTSEQFKKMLFGNYDAVYLDGGKVYEIYNNSSVNTNIFCDAWQLSAESVFVDLSGITDIDRITVGEASRVSAEETFTEQSIVNLGAYKNAIFKKRRNGYYENSRSSHILSVQVSYTSTGKYDGRSSDVLYQSETGNIVNLDHIKFSSQHIDVLASISGSGIQLFSLVSCFSSGSTLSDDNAKLSAEAFFSMPNVQTAFFSDTNTIIALDSDSKPMKITLTRDQAGTVTKLSSESFGVDNCKQLLKATTLDERSQVFAFLSDKTLYNCTYQRSVMKFDDATEPVTGIYVAEDDTIYVTFYQRGYRLKMTTAGELQRIGIGGVGIAYANEMVYVIGADHHLSCYPLANSADVRSLGDVYLDRCYMIEHELSTEIIAYSASKVYEKMLPASPTSLDALTDSDMTFDVTDSMSQLYCIPNPKYEYVVQQQDSESGKEYSLNIFYDKILNGVVDPANQVYIAQDGKVYFDNGNYTLKLSKTDTSLTASKFIDLGSSVSAPRGIAVLSVGTTLSGKAEVSAGAVISYPRKDTLLTGYFDDVIRSTESDGSWYWQDTATEEWMYFDQDMKRVMPKKDINPTQAAVSGSKQLLVADGKLWEVVFTKQESARVECGPKLPLAAGQTICEFGVTNSLINFTTLSSGSSAPTRVAQVYTIDTLDATPKSSEFAASETLLSGKSEDGTPVPIVLSSVWMINGNPTNGVFARSALEPAELSSYSGYLLTTSYGTFLEKLDNVKYNDISKVIKTGTRTVFLSGNQAVTFADYGDVDVFRGIEGSVRDDIGSLESWYIAACQLSGTSESSRALVASGLGIQILDVDSESLGILKVTSSQPSYIGVCQLGNETGYAYSLSGAVLSSLDSRRWRKRFQLEDGLRCKSFLPWSQTTCLFGTDVGLYSTRYKFDMVDDIRAFTRADALSLYSQLLSSQMSSDCENTICSHVETEHLSSALITQVGDSYLCVAFDDIDSSWQKTVTSSSMDLGIKNDIIAEMTFGTCYDGDCIVQVSSYATAGSLVDISAVTYIVKRWMSGLTEIYVNIPTTNTYYLNNLYGASDCKTSQSTVIERKNLDGLLGVSKSQDGQLKTHATEIQLGIASAEYHIDNLLGVEINGYSLPLGIYKDQTAVASGSITGQMFRSFIEPSVVKSWNTTETDDEGNYLFKFACFGTDAQAIHLMFYDQNANSGSETVTVEFKANGGDGMMSKQKFVLTADEAGYPVLQQKSIKKNKFTNTSAGYEKIFAGWSLTPLADNETPAYENSSVFPKSSSWSELSAELGVADPTDILKHKDTLTLYATWLTYQFSNADTTLVFDSNMTEIAIESVGVVESTNLKDKIVVDWGD